MTRPITVIVVFVVCSVFWVSALMSAVFGGLHFWRWFMSQNAATVVSILLLSGGLAMLAIGFSLRYAAMHWIDGAIGFPLAQASRFIVAGGALVMAAAAGAALVAGAA